MKAFGDRLKHIMRKNRCRKLKAARLGLQIGSVVLAKKRQDGSIVGAAISASQCGRWRITWFDADGFSGDTTANTKTECVLLCLNEGYTDSNRNLLRQIQRLESFHEGCEQTTAVARMHGGCMTNAQASLLVRATLTA